MPSGTIAAVNREPRRVAIKYAGGYYAVVAIQSDWNLKVGGAVSGAFDVRGSADLTLFSGEPTLVYVEAARCSADEVLAMLR